MKVGREEINYKPDNINTFSPEKSELYIEYDKRIAFKEDHPEYAKEVERSKQEAKEHILGISEILIKSNITHQITEHDNGFSPWLRIKLADDIKKLDDNVVEIYKKRLGEELIQKLNKPMNKIKPDYKVISGKISMVTKIGKIHWKHQTQECLIKEHKGRAVEIKLDEAKNIKKEIKEDKYKESKLRNINFNKVVERGLEYENKPLRELFDNFYIEGQRNILLTAIGGFLAHGKVDPDEAWEYLTKEIKSEDLKKRKGEFKANFKEDKKVASIGFLKENFTFIEAEIIFQKIKEAFPQKHPKQILKEEALLEDPEDEIEILQEKEELDFTDIKNKLFEYNDYLPNYKLLKKCVTYHHPQNDLFYRSLLYLLKSIEAGVFSYDELKNLPSDNRLHILFIAQAGKGKGLIKNTLKKAMKLFRIIDPERTDLIDYEITGLSHVQQLVGKTKKENKKRVEVPGILSADLIFHDEVQNVLNETDSQHAEAMRIKRQAMDTFGQNEISKKLIDDDFENALSYYSPARCIDFAHPVKLVSKFFKSGTGRRYSLMWDMSYIDEVDLDSLFTDNTKDITEWVDKSKGVSTSIKYNTESLQIINEIAKGFLFFLLKSKNKILIRYALNNLYTIRLHFFKFTNILNSAHQKEESDPKLCLLACLDCLAFQLTTLETIGKYGDLELQEDCWYGLEDDRYLYALEYLLRKGAIDEDSGVPISRFRTVLAELFGVSTRQSRSYDHKLKSEGFIDSKQTGSHTTSLWLKKIPGGINLKQKTIELPGISNLLWVTLSKKNKKNNLLPRFELIIDENKKNSNVGVVGVAIIPPISNNNIYAYNFRSFLFFVINILKEGADVFHPRHPQDKKDNFSTIDEGGIKVEKPQNETSTHKDILDTIEEFGEIDILKLYNKKFTSIPEESFDDIIEKLKTRGDIYETRPGRVAILK